MERHTLILRQHLGRLGRSCCSQIGGAA
ncbi:hypothetical protein ACNKHW_27340 [Shigella flexneri]